MLVGKGALVYSVYLEASNLWREAGWRELGLRGLGREPSLRVTIVGVVVRCPIGRLVVLFAITVWSRHNHIVSASVLRSNSAYALDRPRVVCWRWLIKDIHVVLINIEIGTAGALVLVMLLVVVLATQLRRGARPGRNTTSTAAAAADAVAPTDDRRGGRHARQQQLVAVAGVFRAEGGGERVGNKLVFTFTSRRRGREGARDGLLAGLCRAWPRALLLLCVCVGDQGAGAVLLCDGAVLRDRGLGRGRVVAALEALLHLADARLEGFELGRGGLDDLLSVRGGKQCLSATWFFLVASSALW